MTEDQINKNYLTYRQLLERYKCFSPLMFDEIGEKIKRAPYSTSVDRGGCYDGGMIDVTIRILCKIGIDIAEGVFGTNPNTGRPRRKFITAPRESLIRVLLLYNISKSEIFVPKERPYNGVRYEFSNIDSAHLNTGNRSLYLCSKYGIQLTSDEFYAIQCIGDPEPNLHSGLATTAYTANILTNIELKELYMSEKNSSTAKEK